MAKVTDKLVCTNEQSDQGTEYDWLESVPARLLGYIWSFKISNLRLFACSYLSSNVHRECPYCGNDKTLDKGGQVK